MGTLTMDPSNSAVLWLGTGENNNQRSIAYGDGIYKSEDAGKSWKIWASKAQSISEVS